MVFVYWAGVGGDASIDVRVVCGYGWLSYEPVVYSCFAGMNVWVSFGWGVRVPILRRIV